MAAKTPERYVRRRPQQGRAFQTVQAILEAVVRILKREGFGAITTNRIAEVAGVSIGSVYQYFPDKRAIFIALHNRHIEEIDRRIESVLVEHATSPLNVLITALIEEMIAAHTGDLQLYELLMTEVPHRAGGTKPFAARLHGAFRLALASRMKKKGKNLDRVAFVVATMVESLSHATVLQRPMEISLTEAIVEAVTAVMAYLRS